MYSICMNNTSTQSRGFTLIELLVVIAIIGMLSSAVLASLNSARGKARDARRKEDLHQVQNALALYYNTNGAYPNCAPWNYSTDATWNTTGCLITALKPYMSVLPVDPTNVSNTNPGCGTGPWCTGVYNYVYGVSPSLQNYDLVAQLENTSDSGICQFKQWLFNYYTTVGAGTPVTNASWCSVTYGYSNYMYADH